MSEDDPLPPPWNEALNGCANIGKATLAMRPPRKASSMDGESFSKEFSLLKPKHAG
jgi:hypothetical protein